MKALHCSQCLFPGQGGGREGGGPRGPGGARAGGGPGGERLMEGPRDGGLSGGGRMSGWWSGGGGGGGSGQLLRGGDLGSSAFTRVKLMHRPYGNRTDGGITVSSKLKLSVAITSGDKT